MSDTGDVSVRPVEPEEAPLLVGLIRRCYGGTYIDPSFYDAGLVRARLASEHLSSIGAFVEPGVLVGHMGITARPWGGLTADAGMTLVDPAQRGRGIARKVAAGLAQRAVEMGLIGVHDYPVTVHAATQRLAKGYGVDTGLMLSNMPADVSFESMDNPARGRRTSSLIRWLPFGRAPEREVFLPARYRETITSLYGEARLTRRALSSDGKLPAVVSDVEMRLDTRRQIVRMAIQRAGDDLVDRVALGIEEARQGGAAVAHVDLRLSDSTTPAAVDALRSSGWSFAGLLPEYRDGDALRLQWLDPDATTGGAAVLSSDATRAIEAFVRRDRAAL